MSEITNASEVVEMPASDAQEITENAPAPKAHRGFAVMSPEVRKEYASMGGRAAWASGKANAWTSEQGRAAGKKGGTARWAKHNARKAAEATKDSTKDSAKAEGK